MKMFKTKLWVVTAGCLFVQGVSATSVAVLLEQGIYTEETVGDLPRAIEIYSEIVAEDQANREIVAEALFRLGKCHVAKGHDELALEELQKLVDQYPDQEKLVKRAQSMIADLKPEPTFPELENCRLVYPAPMELSREKLNSPPKEYSFYETDIVEISWTVDSPLKRHLDRFEISVSPIRGYGDAEAVWKKEFTEIESCRLDTLAIGTYTVRLVGYHGADEWAVRESLLEIKPMLHAQIYVNAVQLNGDIQFVGAQQQVNNHREVSSSRFINSDFVHIENMFDANGDNVEFDETHDGRHYRYDVRLNNPVPKGGIHYLGTRGWSEGLVNKVRGSNQEYQYRMNHTPGPNFPVRRVDIYTLPYGAELLETTPADMAHRVLEDGRVELLVDTTIPAAGSLLTEFRYRLERKSDPYVAQINKFKNESNSKEQLEALEQIATIARDAEHSHECLVKLAGLAAKASLNHQRIVKAADIASKFDYHTGGLIAIAGVAEGADQECEELDEILELVVLKLSGTMNMVQLAKDAVKAEGDLEKDAIRDRIAEMRRTTDYQTLEEARVGQKDLFERLLEPAKASEPLSLLPAPWKDGEALIYRLISKDGMEMGAQIWTVDSVERNGVACWEMEQRLVVPASSMSLTTQAIADQERFAPLSSWSKHTMMGEVSAEYSAGKAMLSYAGATPPKNITFDGVVFDNDQALYLIRRLPLTEGYQASFSLIAPLSGQDGPLNCRIKVQGRERVTVPAGEIDCWKVILGVYLGAVKALEQEFLFAVEDDHVVVKVVTPQGDLELVERHLKNDANKPTLLNEKGVVLTLPIDWFSYELPSVGKDAEIVRLLPPGMKLEAMLCKTMRQSGAGSPKAAALKDIEMLKGYFKGYAVRSGSEHKLYDEEGLNTSFTYVADFEDQGKARVEYRAYFTVDTRVFWFVFRMDRGEFESVRAELDAVIDGLRITPDPAGGIAPYDTEKKFTVHIFSPEDGLPVVIRSNVADSDEIAGEYQTPITLESTKKRLDITMISPNSNLLQCELMVDGNAEASCGGTLPWRIAAGKSGPAVSGDSRLRQFFIQMKVKDGERQVGEAKFGLYRKAASRIPLEGYDLVLDAETEPLGHVVLKMQLLKKSEKGKPTLVASPSIKTEGGKEARLTIEDAGATAFTVEVETMEL